MESKKEYKQISVVCNHAELAHGVVDILVPYTERNLLLLGSSKILQSISSSSPNPSIVKVEAVLNDVVLTASQIEGSDLVVFIDHMDWHLKDESQMMSRLNALANVVNCCIEMQNGSFVYIAPFTPMFGRHFNFVINENTIWESSMDLDLQSKYINLAEQEVYRGINEGLKATILSCGFNASSSENNEENNNFHIQDLLRLQRPSYQFIDYKDIFTTLEKVITSEQVPEKLLLIDTTKSRADLEAMIDYRPSFFDKLMLWIRPKKNITSEVAIDNTKTKDWLQFQFINCQAFFNKNHN